MTDPGEKPGSVMALRAWLTAAVLLVNVIAVTFGVQYLFDRRENTVEQVRQTTGNLGNLLADNIGDSARGIDLALQHVADTLERDLAQRRWKDEEVDALLDTYNRRHPEVAAFLLSDAKGDVRWGRGGDQKKPVNIADLDVFQQHRAAPGGYIRITEPSFARIHKTWAVVFTRSYRTPDGRFAGVIIAPVPVARFSQILSRLDLGPRGVAAVRHENFALVSRHPPMEGAGGEIGNKKVPAEFREILASGVVSGSFHAVQTSDGHERTYTFRRIPGTPMVVNVGLALEDSLGPWRNDVRNVLLMYGVFLLVSIAAAWLIHRFWQQHMRQQALIADEVRERTADLAASEARTRAVLHTMADGLIQIDSRGTILLANDAVSTLFGYANEELIGQNVCLLMPEPHRSQHDRYIGNYLHTRTGTMIGKRVEVNGRRKDGSIFPIEMAINEVVDDAGSTFIGVLRDLTLQNEMAAAQSAAMEEAQRLADTKSAFLANMSHEIRTPLNAVLGFARIGMRENRGRQSYATSARIFEAGEHLLGVVNDILDFSKIEAGKLKIESRPFRLAGVIDASLYFVAESVRSKGIELATVCAGDLPAWVTGDALRVEQILANLLSNAVKFTAKGVVKLSVDRTDGSTLRFRIEDTGIGMSADQVGRLFGAFEQADSSTTRAYGGTGLGLAISQRLARWMGGSIAVESTPGSGSTFSLSLPLPEAAPQADPERVVPSAGHRLAGLRLLATDDIEANRLILEDLLQLEGARSVFAADGQQALDLLEEHGSGTFDAVLMDVQMPVLDGYDATREIRKRAPHLPVIGLTAHALAEERDKCLAAGMVDHVAKPVDPDILVAVILHHVGRLPAAGAASAVPAAVPPVPAPVLPVSASSSGELIDLPALHIRFNRKNEFLRKLAASALNGLTPAEEKLADAIARLDHETISSAAHGIKGMSGNLLARPVFELAKATEDAARNKQADAIDLAGQLIRLLGAFRTELTALACADENKFHAIAANHRDKEIQ